MQHLGQVSGFKKKNPGISRGLSVQKLGFSTFSQKRYYNFFLIFCMMIEANTVQHLGLVSGFKKNNPGISMGLSGKKLGFLSFSRKRY